MALHSIQVSRTRMPILSAYDEGRLGVKLNEVLNPLVMGMSISSIQSRIEGKINEIQRSLLQNTHDDDSSNLPPPPPSRGSGSSNSDSVATAELRGPRTTADPNISNSVEIEMDPQDLIAAHGIHQLVINPAHNAILGIQAFLGMRPLAKAY